MHRDVKPENIILEGGKPGGKVFLVDFGGIQQGEQDVADSEVTDTGTLVGTYGYMAPEQLRGSARPASDLFALGGTLLYLLTGQYHLPHSIICPTCISLRRSSSSSCRPEQVDASCLCCTSSAASSSATCCTGVVSVRVQQASNSQDLTPTSMCG